MRTLIFGTSYIRDATDLWIARQWLHLARALNPDADLLIVDSDSPIPPPHGGVDVMQLNDNIGHLSRGGKDGWGRAFCAGLRYAGDEGYDWIVHIETDLLFVRPVSVMLDRMTDARVSVSAPWATPYMFMETGLMFMSSETAMMLAAYYDWENGVGQPELRVEALVRDDWFVSPLRGARDDLRISDLQKTFPGGADYLTHAEIGKYRQLLEQAGLEEAK